MSNYYLTQAHIAWHVTMLRSGIVGQVIGRMMRTAEQGRHSLADERLVQAGYSGVVNSLMAISCNQVAAIVAKVLLP